MSDDDAHGHAPSGKRARAVDQSVRLELARSLRSIYQRVADRIDFDRERLANLLADIEANPARPAVFGLYTDLAESFLSEKLEALQGVSDQLLNLRASCNGTRILTLTDADLGVHQAERYARLVDDDPEQNLDFLPLSDPEAKDRVGQALSLLDTGGPEVAQEVRALAREIVLVTTAGDDGRHFGASTFYLWGATFLAVGRATRLDLAQALAHEVSHLLLFGLMVGRPLVENDPEERYASPLRSDLRPMEGVVHAAFVLTRMHYCLERLVDSGCLSQDERETALIELGKHRERFFDALSTIEEHARFKPEAGEVFRRAVDYMNLAPCGGRAFNA